MKIDIDTEQFQDVFVEYLTAEMGSLVSEFSWIGKSLSTHPDVAYDNMSELVYKIDSIQVVINLIKDKMRSNVFADDYINAKVDAVPETMATIHRARESYGVIYDPNNFDINIYDSLPCDTEPKYF